MATGRAERDPTGDLKGALPPVKGTHFAAVTDLKKVGGMLRAIDAYEGTLIVRCALRLAPLVFVRPGELRHAEWKDIDLDVAEWGQDYYAIGIVRSGTVEKDPTAPKEGQYHVIRGSGWKDASISKLRLTYRDYGNAGRPDVGFRIARYADKR